MNRQHYITMIYQHLNDHSTYVRKNENCDKKVMIKIQNLNGAKQSLAHVNCRDSGGAVLTSIKDI